RFLFLGLALGTAPRHTDGADERRRQKHNPEETRAQETHATPAKRIHQGAFRASAESSDVRRCVQQRVSELQVSGFRFQVSGFRFRLEKRKAETQRAQRKSGGHGGAAPTLSKKISLSARLAAVSDIPRTAHGGGFLCS